MNLSTHPVEKEEVMAYLDGELPVERAAAVAGHLEHCSECHALAGELCLVSEQLSGWQVEASPGSLTERLTAAIEEHEKKPLDRDDKKARAGRPDRRHLPLRTLVLGLAGGFAILLLLVALSIPNLLRSRMAVNHAQDATGLRGGISGRVDAGPTDQVERYMTRPTSGPMIVRTAALTLVSKEFDPTRSAIETIVRQHQGYIAQLTVTGQTGAGHTLNATLRLPASQLDAVLIELKKLGRVERESQGGDEVTAQYVDLVARLSNARNTEQRLVEVLRQRAGKVADILAVEQEISRVRGEIERMEAERKSLENKVQYATVQLQLGEEYKAELEVTPPSTGTRLRNAMVEGYRGAVNSAVDLALVLFSYGPSLLFWVLIFFWPARLAWRRLRA